jgi:aerobic carbon-monoxide dehydrogenase small subunit
MPVPSDPRAIRLQVNGRPVERAVDVSKNLADFLREDLELTGTHVGCEHGVCGSCTILLNGEPVRSCLLFAVQASGADVRTVESLGTIDNLHPLQVAFRQHHGLQCGFCTPGILMSTVAFLEETPAPTEAEIREMLTGHLCRCTGYQNIVEAIRAAASPSPRPTGPEWGG